MKTTLISVSISCILGLSLFGEAANVPTADKPELGVKSTVNRPTHIIKLKASNIGDFKDFEATSFIKNHYTTFQALSGSLKEKNEAFSFDPNASEAPASPSEIVDISIDDKFKAVAGTFHHAFANYLSSLDDIEYVEPNRVYKAPIFPATSEPQPYTSKGLKSVQNVHSIERRLEKRGAVTQKNVPSWGIARINHRNRDDLNSYTLDEQAGDGVSVYIFDTGIVPNHPDFADRAAIAANFIEYEDAVDLAGHGTHVAGTIGGNAFGIAKNAKLLGVKILDKYGDGETLSLLRAISYVASVAERGKSLINLSLSGPRSQTVDDAISMIVEQHGIPVFVSSGNEGNDACNYSPSSNPSAFTVGASTSNDIIPGFSGHGNCVRLYAPGTNITSAWLNGQVQTLDGTSMANPHVSGIAAMLMSKYDFDTPHELYDALKSVATAGVLSANNGEDNQLLAYYDANV